MPWHSAYILGLIYDVVSDFGRSIMRPVYFWITLFLISMMVYLSSYQTNLKSHELQASWPERQISLLHEALIGNLTCSSDAQDFNPLEEAANLALKHGLLMVGASFDGRLNQSVECLYGKTKGSPNCPSGLGWQTLQSLLSAPLIFLFLLAVRNRFKIK
jgi:hypothetical protein